MAKSKTKDKGSSAAEGGIRLTAHPRARRDISMAKGWGGLAAFGLVLVLSLNAGVPLSDALLRAILGGLAGFVFAWGVAVAVWRHVALAEIERTKRDIAGPPKGPDAAPKPPEGHRA
jgi:hypothetical protein